MPAPVPASDAVTIDHERVRAVARTLRSLGRDRQLQEEAWDDGRFWNVEASRRQRCQYLAVGNAINFRFWELHYGEVIPQGGTIGGEQFRGSMYLWRRLRRAVDRGEFGLDSDSLNNVSVASLREAFSDDTGHCPLEPGLEDRVANLADLGERLALDWKGWFINALDACHGGLDRFVEVSRTFRAFDDPVQKLTMLNALMLQGSGLVSFDRNPLPAIDYHLVKQAVRQGIVKPGATIESKLKNAEFLSTDESVALRFAVLEALQGVAAAADLSTAILDNLYWLNRRICADSQPECSRCPFEASCAKTVSVGLPLEMTRYY